MRTTVVVARMVLCVALAGACARHAASQYPAGTVAGYYEAAFEEQSTFRTCDGRPYRIVAPAEFWSRHERIRADTPERERPVRVFAILAATIGPEDPNASHMATGVRSLTVTRVYTMRRAGGNDCSRWLAGR